MHIERTGNESIRRSAPAAGADAQLVLRNHRNGRRQTVRPDDDHADRGTEIDVPALRTIASNRDLTQHRSCSRSTRIDRSALSKATNPSRSARFESSDQSNQLVSSSRQYAW